MEQTNSSTARQLKWIVRLALAFIVSSAILLLILKGLLDKELGQDYTEAFASLKQLDSSLYLAVGIPVAIYVLVASILVIAVKLFFTHSIAGPLFRLEACARSIEEGDLTFYSQVRQGDHLKRLAAAMGELREDLRKPLQDAHECAETVGALLDKMAAPGNSTGNPELLEAELVKLESALKGR